MGEEKIQGIGGIKSGYKGKRIREDEESEFFHPEEQLDSIQKTERNQRSREARPISPKSKAAKKIGRKRKSDRGQGYSREFISISAGNGYKYWGGLVPGELLQSGKRNGGHGVPAGACKYPPGRLLGTTGRREKFVSRGKREEKNGNEKMVIRGRKRASPSLRLGRSWLHFLMAARANKSSTTSKGGTLKRKFRKRRVWKKGTLERQQKGNWGER